MAGSLFALICCLASCGPDGGASCAATHDACDVIEINHAHFPGGPTLDQVIFWDWSPRESRYVVRAWRMLRGPGQLPYRRAGGGYRACWHDARDGNALRVMSAGSVIETWTDYDPEVQNQAVLDRHQRRELTPPRSLRERGRR